MSKLLNRIVMIDFLDHSQSSGSDSGPILCRVVGIISKVTKIHFEVTTWKCADGVENSHNNEVFSIIKSTIECMYIFGRGKEIKNFR